MEYIGKKTNIIDKLRIFSFYLRIDNENLLDLHGYLSNMVDWLKLV